MMAKNRHTASPLYVKTPFSCCFTSIVFTTVDTLAFRTWRILRGLIPNRPQFPPMFPFEQGFFLRVGGFSIGEPMVNRIDIQESPS